MTRRDRMVLIVLVAVALLVLVWIKFVSPERKRASSVQEKVASAEVTLAKARSELAGAQQDQKRFSSAYASLVSLGEAVPAAQEVSAVVYAVDEAAGHASVEFQSISASSGSSSSSSTETAATSASSGGFQQLPFTFTFVGSFFDLYHLMQKLQGFTVSTSGGEVRVSGRLLTINGLSLSAATTVGAGRPSGQLTGTVTATAYVLPPGETLTAGATSSAPAGTSAASSSSSSSSSSSTSAAPAVVKVAP